MSTWTLRPVSVPDDFPRIAAIHTACNPEPTTVAELVEYEAKSKYEFQLRLAGVTQAGLVAGIGVAQRYAEDPPGQFYVKVTVDPAFRGQGLGTALADALEARAVEQGATAIASGARDNDPRSVAFARARGLETEHHLFESTLDPNTFDETPFAGVVERVAVGGIRFFTLADEPGEATERKLYDLYNLTAPDIPGFDLTAPPPFEEWRQWVVTASHARPELTLLAAVGDDLVGCSVMIVRASGALYTDYTGVLREYRGREIALALKLLSIRAARAFGTPYMRTNNDAKNGPMLAVNQKLGYQPCAGFYRMRKRLTQ